MKRTDKRRHNPGRPSEGLDTRIEVRVSADMLADITRVAARYGLTASQWLRHLVVVDLAKEKAK